MTRTLRSVPLRRPWKLTRTRSSTRSRPSIQFTLFSVLLVSLMAYLPGCATSELQLNNATNSRPNIIFIFGDDIGFGDIGANGNQTFLTPNIDALARDGTNYQNFTVASPVCSPSRAAVLTGQYPDRHDVFQHFASSEHHQRHGMPDWLDTSAPSIATVLQEAGYVTGHFGKWHLTNSHISGAPEPSEYGFDEYAVFNGPGPQTDAVQVFSDAMDFIKNNQSRPFFMNLWIHETHTPHYPDPVFFDDYTKLDERQRMYAATMASADFGVGQVRDTLEELGLTQNTIVIFSSDNGPEVTGDESARYLPTDPDAAVEGRDPLGRYYSVGETGGLRGRKRDLYEGGVRVPFIVSWPGVVEANAVDETSVINAVDLFLTFADVANAKAPSNYKSDGQSLKGLFEGEAFERIAPLFWQRLAPLRAANSPRTALQATIRDGKWKLLRRGSDIELYDINANPEETRNLADANPDIVEEMTRQLDTWQRDVAHDSSPTAQSNFR